MKKRLLLLPILFLVLFVPLTAVFAQENGRTVDENEEIVGDVVLFSEDLSVADGGTISGDVTLFNGNADIAGTISGDLVVMNGDVVLADTAVIQGECVVLNGTVTTARVTTICTKLEDIGIAGDLLDTLPLVPPPNNAIETTPSARGFWLASRIGTALTLAVFMGLMAVGFEQMLPTQSARIQETMRQEKWSSRLIGLLTMFAIPTINTVLFFLSTVLLIVCVGIIGYPIILAITLGYVAAAIWTWVFMGKWVGAQLSRRFNWDASASAQAAVGTAVVTFGLTFIAISSWVGFILISLLSIIPLSQGVGAITLTRFGTRPYPIVHETVPQLDDDKVTAVLKTLPDTN